MATLETAKIVVVKVGSALLVDPSTGQLRETWLHSLIDDIATRTDAGTQFIVVSSGSIAEGMSRMGWTRRPKALPELQAAAAIGQTG
mgnify:CR=1 FL=1